jgi:TonB family protein
LDFGESKLGRQVSDLFALKLASPDIEIPDRDLVRSAVHGYGYQGSLNLSVGDARDLGNAIGCDFYFLGDAQTLRRSPSSGAHYFESYVSIFLVSVRTGRLISWQRPRFEAPTPEQAEQSLVSFLQKAEWKQSYLNALETTQNSERLERERAVEHNTPVIEEASEDTVEAAGLRTPRPYRRFLPAYPDSAAIADAIGTVDVLVDLDKEGEVNRVDLARWAGFGMDEAAMETVRRMHFFPAMRDGVAIPIRVLLRYNFRRPTK